MNVKKALFCSSGTGGVLEWHNNDDDEYDDSTSSSNAPWACPRRKIMKEYDNT